MSYPGAIIERMSELLVDPGVEGLSPRDRLDAVFAELAQLCGQRNVLDGRIVDLIAELDRDELWGMTGAKSLPSMVAWKTGMSLTNAQVISKVARRAEAFPQCVAGLRTGRVSIDQVGAVAAGAPDGSDAHYAELIPTFTVAQLRHAISLEPRPEPEVKPEIPRALVRTERDDSTTYKITLPRAEAATVDTALQAHLDALVNEWKRENPEHPDAALADPEVPVPAEFFDSPAPAPPAGARPMPNLADAFMSVVEAGWDTEVARRPQGQRTQVAVHVNLKDRIAALHLGPLLSDADRRFLLCDATCEVWYERNGRLVGVGRATRTVNRRLRRALEYRDRCCVVPGCHATRGLHAHHLRHWEDGGATDLSNLVLLCPFHHRAHHRGDITIIGPAEQLRITDADGNVLTDSSVAQPPTQTPPKARPYPGSDGGHADWWWYTPYEPPPPDD